MGSVMEYNYTVHENTYGKYAVPEKVEHTPTAQTVIRGHVWEPKTIKFVQEHVNNQSMVHAGTYFGDMLPAFSKSTTGTVYAFEAVPENFYCAKQTINLNKLDNVILTNAGVSEKEGTLDIGISNDVEKFGGQSSFCKTEDNTVTVKVVTIDSAIKDPVSIIQLDVEGHEMEALRGAIETIRKYKPILILETVDQTDSFWKEEILPLGYKQTATVHVNSVWEI
jgi:FkbM family methyltransferase